MNELSLITAPVAEPVSVEDMMIQLGIPAITADDDVANQLTAKLTRIIRAARAKCEDYTRRVFLTQTWLLSMDGFPPVHMRYAHSDRPHEFLLPKPPFQSIAFFTYVDTTGTVQTLPLDTSYGNATIPSYAYQLPPVGDNQPARLWPMWARPWPPTRWLPGSVQVQFKCGYGGPVTASVTEGSPILTGPVFLPGDVGQAVCVPKGSTGGLDLVTSIASVDGDGVATLAANAGATVASAKNNVWVGLQVPPSILDAIIMMAEFLYKQGGETDVPLPRAIMNLLDPYRNLVA